MTQRSPLLKARLQIPFGVQGPGLGRIELFSTIGFLTPEPAEMPAAF
jgi:hypothetical protein